jgi:quercetin dioxygenase-like cupin family protein
MTDIARQISIPTLHLHTDELPWVTDGTLTYRLFQVRLEDEMVVGQFRVPAGLVSPLHRHIGPSILFTVSGTWGHRAEMMDHRAGTYVYEPIGAVHRYYGGTQVELVDMSVGGTEILSDDGDVVGLGRAQSKLERYLQLCEEQGLERVNLLR